METPHLPKSIFGKDFQNVYEPAEDTFLLLDALENDLETLKKDAIICLECGSGSGTIITALSMALDADQASSNRLMLATDINEFACQTTVKCAAYHNQSNIQVVRTNLAQSLIDRLKNSVNLMIFNPPYVPTDKDEDLAASRQLQYSWAGGVKGRELVNQFLNTYVTSMLCRSNGSAYIVALHQNNIEELKDYLKKDYHIQGEVVLERRAGSELLYVIKYQFVATEGGFP